MRSQNFRGNVFVANLPPEISDEQLAEAFDAFGIVLSATVAHDPETGKRLRYGFVDIATERAAKLAVASMNGAAIDGYNLDVRISERPVTAKKPRAATPRAAGVPQRSPRRVMPRPGDDGDERPGTFTPRPQPRKQPSFQVERRSLPRRSG
jgi:RNA recognition motif-containing protein